MNRFYLAPLAVLLLVGSQAQALNPCGGYTYHYRVHGHAAGTPLVGSGLQTFHSAPLANFQFVPARQFTFGFTQPQALGTFTFNASPAASPAEALLPATIIEALKLACKLVGNGNPGGGGNAAVDLAPLTAKVDELTVKVKALKDETARTFALVAEIHGKILTQPKAAPIVPKEMPKAESLPVPRSNPKSEAPCEFTQLRERAERLAAASGKAEVVLTSTK